MNKPTAEALEESIDHWAEVVKSIRDNLEKEYDYHDYHASIKGASVVQIGRTKCALCEKFNHLPGEEGLKDCRRCPVKKKTGYEFCNETPYHRFSNQLISKKTFDKKHVKLAQAELRFLKSLRDKK